MGKKSLAALLCATMAMTACMLPATAAMADEPLKIEFFQQKGEEGPQKGYKEIIDKFNKENSDIEIEMNTVPDAGTVLTSRISSGDIPVILSYFVLRNRMSKRRHAVRRSPSVKFQNPLYCTNSFHQHNTMSFFSATYRKSTISNKRIFRCFFVFQIIFYICHTAFFLTSKNLPYFNIIQNFFFPAIFHCI